MDNDIERFRQMASMAQLGWWEADFTAGHYVCSEYLCDLLGLEGNTISFTDFRKRVREDYQEQIVREFNAAIHREFYEQTFPIHSKEGIVCCTPVWGSVKKYRAGESFHSVSCSG